MLFHNSTYKIPFLNGRRVQVCIHNRKLALFLYQNWVTFWLLKTFIQCTKHPFYMYIYTFEYHVKRHLSNDSLSQQKVPFILTCLVFYTCDMSWSSEVKSTRGFSSSLCFSKSAICLFIPANQGWTMTSWQANESVQFSSHHLMTLQKCHKLVIHHFWNSGVKDSDMKS